MTAQEQLAVIRRGTVSVISESELLAKLEQSQRTGRPLRVKLGIDPTAPDIHLGFTVVLRKLRQFQDIGHQAVLLIGDYTAMVGDPSGRSKTRPQLTPEEIEHNALTYLEQASKVLRMDRLELVRNGDWFRNMTFTDVLRLASKMTVARMLERDDFSKRYAAGEPISLHEMLYPLMQGYDSVMVRADVELGGTDQMFNLMVGRDLLIDAGFPPQCCVMTPILPGLDGVQKMSKSLGNYVGVAEPPNEKFGKLMSIPDSLMRDYFMLLTDVPEEEVAVLLSEKVHPRDAKARLAREIVAAFDGPEAAREAEEEFNRVFRQKDLPSEIPNAEISAALIEDGQIGVLVLFSKAGLVSSNNEAKRLIEQGGASIDGERIKDVTARVSVHDGMILRAGKRRFARVRLVD